jgi:hypothetical protein
MENQGKEQAFVSIAEVPGELVPEGTRIRIFPHFQPAYEVEVWRAGGRTWRG